MKQLALSFALSFAVDPYALNHDLDLHIAAGMHFPPTLMLAGSAM